MITDNTTGEILCQNCGRVLVEKVEEQLPEYRIAESEDYFTKNRVGSRNSLALYDKGLTTVINFYDKDASGKKLPRHIKVTFDRLRIWDSRITQGSLSKNMKPAFLLLDAMKSKLVLPYVVQEKAAYVFRKALSSRIKLRWGSSSLMLASIYVACKETNTPRTLDEIALAAGTRKRVVGQNYITLIKTLNLKLRPYDSAEFITQIASKLGLSENTRRHALKILSNIDKTKIPGRKPIGLAASAVYLSCISNSERKSQAEVASVAGVSCVTIKVGCAALRNSLL